MIEFEMVKEARRETMNVRGGTLLLRSVE